MTQDDVIRLARKAGFVCLMPDEAMDMIGGIFEGDVNLLGNFEAFAKLVAEHEREACAEICEQFQARDVGMQPAECAGAIRARGQA